MTISVVASLPNQAPVSANDSAASSIDAADGATGSQDFLNLLLSLGQALSPAAATLTTTSLEPTKETDPQALASEPGTTDPASLLAALGIVSQDIKPEVQSAKVLDTDSKITTIRDDTGKSALTATTLGTSSTRPELSSTETPATPTAAFSLPAEAGKTAKFAAETSIAAATTEQKPAADSTSETPAPVNTTAIGMETQAKTSTVGTTTHTAPLNVHTPVHTNDWNHDFSQKIVWMASNDKQSAQITLNPEQMGPIEVSLSVDKGNVTASFTSANAQVREAIETALPRLREMFASAGIELGQTNVSAESFRQPTNEQEAASNASTRSHSNGILMAGSTASVAANTSYIQRQGNGLVDIFA